MIEQPITKEEIDKVVSYLIQIELFRKLSKSVLKELASSMEKVFLEGGDVLITEGEVKKNLYLLYQGRLRVFKRQMEKSGYVDSPIGEISPGQIIGEIALLTDKPRTATVVASRDSILLKLSEEMYHKVEKVYPEGVLEFVKSSFKRFISSSKAKSDMIGAMAVAPAGDSHHWEFAKNLFQELNQIKPTLLITKDLCNEHFGRDVAQTKEGDYSNETITTWLRSLENSYEYIIYETDRQMTPWTKRCLRQVDRIFLVAEENANASLNSIELNLFQLNNKQFPLVDLLFLHPTDRIQGSSKWLDNRPVSGYHHIRLNSVKDKNKFIRFLNGKSIGLVLNGGGARGLSHIGALRAFEELGIPIDFIAGTSMGAVIAACYALGLNNKEIVEFAHKFKYHHQFTLPIVSLMTGKFLTDMTRALSREKEIEDLKIRFFCVSANISKGNIFIHDSGPLWRALRATTSIPGIFPPVCNEEGHLLVDGGILNNMPVDILRKRMFRGKILSIKCCSNFGERFTRRMPETWLSGWRVLYQKYFSKKKVEFENIYSIILESLNVCSMDHQKSMEKEADWLLQFDTGNFDLLQFDQTDEIIEIGYKKSLQILPEFIKQIQF